jgi:hypothetical protein
VAAALRFLICIVLSSFTALAATPARTPVVQVEKSDCCARMKADAADRECEQHAPKSHQEQQCCAACSLGLALLVSPARPFLYPSLGDETFPAFVPTELSRSERPPVPPPRA